MRDKHMILGAITGQPYGTHPGAWRMPWAGANEYTDIEAQVRAAQAAERGGFDFTFYPDRVFVWGDLQSGPPIVSMEPLMSLAAVAHATKRIGLVSSASTSFSEPYAIARQLRALDLISHGRAGWNAIPSYEPEAFANYGLPAPEREDKYQRLYESIQVTQALWASWERAAGEPDKAAGRFANTAHIRPVNLHGQQVGSRGPLQVPPSEQGQPPIFMPFASGMGIQAAGLYADGIIAMPTTLESSRSQRDMIRSVAVQSGRQADDVKFVPFMAFGLGATQQEAVERRIRLEEAAGIDQRLAQLSATLGYRFDPVDRHTPLTGAQIAALRPNHSAPQVERAVEVASRGVSPLEILGHGVLDPNPGIVGTPEQAADMLVEWMEAGVADGFTLSIDDMHDGIDAFSDQVMPILRRRGWRPDDYEGATLRDHMGVKEQLGIDARLARAGD